MKTSYLKSLVAAVALSAAALNAGAVSLTIGDANELGFVNFGIPAGDADVTAYVNQLIGMSLGSTTNVLGQTIQRSSNTFSPMDAAVLASRTTYGTVSGNTVDINVGSTGYEYLLVKYDGPNYGSEVWYIGGLTGTITIPAYPLFNNDGSGKFGISGSSLFTRYPGSTSVPDGGATIAMLACALVGVETVRRKLAASK